MGRDRREDEGQYYPGGKVIPTTPHQGGGSIVLDDTVTETSANGVKSSGIWTFVRGLLDALTLQWSKVTGKPTTFPPSAHAASHKTGGSDALAPSDIGAVAAVPGKGLSTNDYTNAEKTKLAGIEAGAQVNPTPVAPSTEIAEGATADAKKVAEFVNSSINAMAAFYITKNAAGDAFATKSELTAAIASGTFYNGGQLRVPTKNDYLYVLADESATPVIPGVAPTTRYSFDGAQWAFQIIVNNTALTSAQVAAINSGINAALVLWLSTFRGNDTSTTLASVLTALAEKVPWANAAHNAVTIGSRQSGSAIGDNSLAQGENVKATGYHTHAEGVSTHAEGNSTHAEGYHTHAEGVYTHAEGYYTHAEGYSTHAEGDTTHAEGDSTHAEGDGTHAEGTGTHAEGGYTTAGKSSGNRGRYAHAAGFNAQATNVTAFTWNGSAKDNPSTSSTSPDYVPPYGDHGNGTYNLNPVGGPAGIWIGENTLADLFNVKAAISDFSLSAMASYVSALFSIDNSALMGVVRYKFGTAITADATLADRTGNLVIVTSTDIDLDLPDAHTDGTMRDLLIRIEMGASATGTPTINLPATWEGDAIPAFAAGKNYLLALTETKAAAGTTPAAWYVRVIELAAQTPNA